MKDAVPNAIDLPSFRGTRTGLETEDIKRKANLTAIFNDPLLDVDPG